MISLLKIDLGSWFGGVLMNHFQAFGLFKHYLINNFNSDEELLKYAAQ